MISVLVVSLNAGEDLLRTVESTLAQCDNNYEIIIKDGGSNDGSIDRLPKSEKIHLICQKDSSIYNAMNQAIEYASGDYCLFMNCGDLFYDDNVISRIHSFVRENVCSENTIVYGDCYTENRDVFVRYPDVFDDNVCLTKTLCHQATLYPTVMLKKRGFNEKYNIAGDYEYYVNAYANGCCMVHIPMVIVRYQGNGASETPKNLKKSIAEANNICREKLGEKRYRKALRRANLKGFQIKRFLVRQEWFYPIYKKIAKIYYNLLKR